MIRSPIFLSDTVARNAKPRDREYALQDNRLSGFFLRIQPSGAKTWILRAKNGARHRRITLGPASAMRAEEARACAHQEMAALAPAEIVRTKRTERAAMSFGALAQAFLEARQGLYKPSTVRAFKIYINAVLLPAFGARPVNQITTAEVAEWFYATSMRRPGGANQAMRHFRTILKFARETGRLPRDAPNPTKPIRLNTRRARGRLLNTEQLEKLGAWLDHPPPRWIEFAEVVRLILLTGCRSGEIARLTWAEVLDDRLRLASAKTGPRDVLLSRPALALLDARRRKRSTPFVFPNPVDLSRPMSATDGAWRAIRANIGLPTDIRLHDLRHTYASHAIMSGETITMAGQLLGHRAPRSTEIYAHLDAGHLLNAADRVSEVIAGWIG